MECTIKAPDCADYFGLSIKIDEELDNGYLLVFDIANQQVS